MVIWSQAQIYSTNGTQDVVVQYKGEQTMGFRWIIASTSLLIVSLPVGAIGAQSDRQIVNFADTEKPGQSTVVKAKPKHVVLQAAPQVLCMEKMPTGTRIKKLRCKTIATWKNEMEEEEIRKYLLEQ